VREHVSIERVQRWIVDVGLEDPFAQVVENRYASHAAKTAECFFVQFGPDPRARLLGQQPN
jgi:hypothetical protein